MFFRVILFVWDFVLDLAAVSRMTDDEKDLEILLLRQQLRIVERKQERGPQIPRWQKVPLVALVLRLKQKASHSRQALEDSVRLFKPATVLGWHREIVRRKWTYQQKRQPGRPPIDAELEQWILRVAQDNPGLGVRQAEGGTAQTGLQSESDDHSYRPPTAWHSACTGTFTVGEFLAHLSQPLQRAVPGVRFSDGRNPHSPNAIYPLFYRTCDPTGLSGRLHGSSRFRLGQPTSSTHDLGTAGSGFTHALSDP